MITEFKTQFHCVLDARLEPITELFRVYLLICEMQIIRVV